MIIAGAVTVEDTNKSSIPKITMQINGFFFMQSVITGNINRPRPFDNPQINMTVVIIPATNPEF